MAASSRTGLVAMIALSTLFWALSHGYEGIIHDARLYTLQALAHQDPAALSADVFLKYGSQDRFTVFSPIYAAAQRLLGVEPAAATLTLALQIGLFWSAWLLARTMLSPLRAAVAVATLVALPGAYGADRIFTCVEPFLTPRMAAEALTLCTLAALLRGRALLAAACALGATLLHPIMAVAGLIGLCIYHGFLPRPRTAALVAFAIGSLVVAALTLVPAAAVLRFDPIWLHLVQARSPYLFLTNWQIEDWAKAAVPIATLCIGLATLRDRARRLCQLALLATLAGLALSATLSDGLHVVLVTQLQPWRCLWLGTAVAMLLLVHILDDRRQRGAAGMMTASLLAAAWIFCGSAYALVAAVAAVLSLAADRMQPVEQRLLLWGSCGLLAIAVIWRIASNLEFTDVHYLDFAIPWWARATISFCRDGSVPLAVIVLAAWCLQTNRGRGAAVIVTLAGLTGVAALLPMTWRQWTGFETTPVRVAQFSAWRARIPAGVDVFWPEAPALAWLLLDRPNYLSITQSSGLVFSRGAALELQRRAIALSGVVGPEFFLGWSTPGGGLRLSKEQLRGACNTAEFRFLVTRADLGVAPLEIIREPGAKSDSSQRLYRCPLAGAG